MRVARLIVASLCAIMNVMRPPMTSSSARQLGLGCRVERAHRPESGLGVGRERRTYRDGGAGREIAICNPCFFGWSTAAGDVPQREQVFDEQILLQDKFFALGRTLRLEEGARGLRPFIPREERPYVIPM
jgi:hypothetical protein